MKIYTKFRFLSIISFLFLVISLTPSNLFALDSDAEGNIEVEQIEQEHTDSYSFPTQIRPGVKGGANITRFTADLLLPIF